jgi:hypothetical protein
MSRVTRRAGTKNLICMHCQRLCKGTQAKTRMSFRGQSQARLDRHIEQVHIHPRSIRAPE